MDQIDRVTQAYSQAPWRVQLQFLGLFSLGLVFIALVAGTYLNVTARAATVGREIQQMRREIDELEYTNANLQAQLAFINSAVEMEKRAQEMGFSPVGPDEAMFIVVDGYVERHPVILAPYAAPVTVSTPAMPAEWTESIFDWLQRELADYSGDKVTP